jgi:hypothetical protein
MERRCNIVCTSLTDGEDVTPRRQRRDQGSLARSMRRAFQRTHFTQIAEHCLGRAIGRCCFQGNRIVTLRQPRPR